MKKMFDAIQKKMLEVENLNIPIKTKIITLAFSILFGILSVIGLIAMIINFAILDQKLMKLYAFLIVTLVNILVLVTTFLYTNGIVKGRVKGLWKIYLFDTAIVSIFMYILLMILFIIGVF